MFFQCLFESDLCESGGEFVVKQLKLEGFEFGPLRKFQKTYNEQIAFGGVNYGLPILIKPLNTSLGISMIFIFANVWFVDDHFLFIWISGKAEYCILAETRAKCEDAHDDLRGCPWRNIEY